MSKMSKAICERIRAGDENDRSMEGTSSQTDEIILSQQKDFQYECLNIVEVLRKGEDIEKVIKKVESLPKHFAETTWTIRQMYHSFYMLYKHQANNAEEFSKQNEALNTKTAGYQQELDKLTNEIADLKEERRQREMENEMNVNELNKNITFLGKGLGYTIEDISGLEAQNKKLESRKEMLSADRRSLIRKLQRERAKNADLIESLSLQTKTSVEERKVGEREIQPDSTRNSTREVRSTKNVEPTSSKFNVLLSKCRKLPNVFKSSKTNVDKDSAKKITNIKSVKKSFFRIFRSNKIAPI